MKMQDRIERRGTLEPTPPSPASASSVDGILVRAGQTVAVAGERLLVERLHRALDEESSLAVTMFATTVLPQIQELVAMLPDLLREEEPAATEVIRTLATLLHEHGVSPHDMVDEGVDLYDRLLHEVALHLRENDRALVVAISRLSHTVLKMELNALLAYHDHATATLAQLAHSDSLTGLANRRYFEMRFDEELLRAQRMQRPLALTLLDVDGLKLVNDTYGHASGDQLLRGIALVLRRQARGIDVAARIGGDEFVLLLPETDRTGATTLLERLAQGIADQRINDQVVRFSAGIAVYPDDGRTLHDLIERADSALYRVKRAAQP